MGFGAPLGPQEHLGKWVTGVKGDQKGSVALRVTWAGLVPKESLEWLGQAENQACQARMAKMVCRDLMVRRERLVAMVAKERKAPMGCRGSLDEQGPKARRENRVELASWVRLAPLESQVSLEMLVFQGSVVRLVTGAPWELLAHKVLLVLLASVAFRDKKAAQETLAFRAPKAYGEMWVTGVQEVPQALRETRALQVPMVFQGTKASWVLMAPLDKKESLAAEGNWAPKASRAPMAPVESRVYLVPQVHWASKVCRVSQASPGSLEFRARKPVNSASGSYAGV